MAEQLALLPAEETPLIDPVVAEKLPYRTESAITRVVEEMFDPNDPHNRDHGYVSVNSQLDYGEVPAIAVIDGVSGNIYTKDGDGKVQLQALPLSRLEGLGERIQAEVLSGSE